MKYLIPLVLLTCSLVGCSSLGTKTVPKDHFNYNAAIARSAQEQLLVNLIRLRYNETPVFLKVSSVISQYTLSGSVNAGFSTKASILGDDTGTVGGRLFWADRPTITYTPVSGQEFSRNLLTPIPPRATFELMLAGWPADLVMRVTTIAINGIDNDIARPSQRRQAEPELYELFHLWR